MDKYQQKFLEDGAFYDYVQGVKLTVSRFRNQKKEEELRQVIKQGMIDLNTHKQVRTLVFLIVV